MFGLTLMLADIMRIIEICFSPSKALEVLEDDSRSDHAFDRHTFPRQIQEKLSPPGHAAIFRLSWVNLSSFGADNLTFNGSYSRPQGKKDST